MYADASELADRRGGREHRQRLVAGLHGRVIKIGAGKAAPVPISAVAGHGDALPADDHNFDAAVVSLVLCTVPSVPSALAEITRALKPGGRLYFYEHVRSPNPVFGLLEDLITPAWRRVAAGCHPNRNTLASLERAGFIVEEVERFTFAPQPMIPRTAHILGRARLRDHE